MFNLSAAMGARWAEICLEFDARIRNLGPSPVRLALEKKNRMKNSEEEQHHDSR